MTNISPAAAANREHARETNGQFGQQTHSAPAPLPIYAGDRFRRDQRRSAVTDIYRLLADQGTPIDSVTVARDTNGAYTITTVSGRQDWDTRNQIREQLDVDTFVDRTALDKFDTITYDFTNPNVIAYHGKQADGTSTLVDRWLAPHDTTSDLYRHENAQQLAKNVRATAERHLQAAATLEHRTGAMQQLANWQQDGHDVWQVGVRYGDEYGVPVAHGNFVNGDLDEQTASNIQHNTDGFTFVDLDLLREHQAITYDFADPQRVVITEDRTGTIVDSWSTTEPVRGLDLWG